MPPHSTWRPEDRGEYAVILQPREVVIANGNHVPPRLLGYFRVAIGDRVPAEVRMEVAPRENGARVHVRVHMVDPYYVISGQAPPTVDGSHVLLNATAERVTFIRPPDEPAIFDLVYDIDDLAPGTYVAVFALNGSPYARIQFHIPVHPMPRRPNVSSLEIGSENGIYFAAVAVVIRHPLADLLKWGEVQRAGNTFFVRLSYQQDGADPAGSATGDETGFPVRLLTHTYRLGAIDPGEYAFAVVWGDERIAVRRFEVFDPDVPKAQLRVRDVLVPGAEIHPFMVLYSDDGGMALDTIRTARPVVTGPNGFSSLADVVAVVAEDDLGRKVRAEYAVGAPGGFWDAQDRGGYRVSVDPASIADTDGNTLQRGELGGFRAFVLSDAPPSDAPGTVELHAREVEGIWGVDVVLSFGERPFSVSEWGHVKVAGNLFSVNLRIAPPLNDSGSTDRAVWRHTYRLGALHPGAYIFVFTSNLGHVQRLLVEVPREPVTDLFGSWSGVAVGAGGGSDVSEGAGSEFSDPDGDGLVNLLEYAFGLNPLTGTEISPVNSVLVGSEEGSRHLGLSFSRVITASDIQYTVEVSDDLSNWVSGGDLVEIVEVREESDGTETVTVCLHQPVDQSPYPYMRLRVSQAAGAQ